MKCAHCSASVEKREWFCSNCKRSIRTRPARAPRRAGSISLFAATALLSLTLGAAAGLRFQSPPPAPPALAGGDAAPLVRIISLDAPAQAGLARSGADTLLVGFSR